MTPTEDVLHHLRSLLDAPASRSGALVAYRAAADAHIQLTVPMIQGRVVRLPEARLLADALEPLLHQAITLALRWEPSLERDVRSLPPLPRLDHPAPFTRLAALPPRPADPFTEVSDPGLRTLLTSLQERAARSPSELLLGTPGDAGPLETLAARSPLPLPTDVRDLYAAVSALERPGQAALVPAEAVTVLPGDDGLPARWRLLSLGRGAESLDLSCFLRDGRTHWSSERSRGEFGSLRHARPATVAEVVDFAMASAPPSNPRHAWQSFAVKEGPRSLYVLQIPGQSPRGTPLLVLHARRRQVLEDVLYLVRSDLASDLFLIDRFARSTETPLALHLIEEDRWRSVLDLRPLVTAKVGDLPRVTLAELPALRERVGPATFDPGLERTEQLSLRVSARALDAAIPRLTGARLEPGRTMRLVGETAGLPEELALGMHDPDEGTWDLAFQSLEQAAG